MKFLPHLCLRGSDASEGCVDTVEKNTLPLPVHYLAALI